MKFVSWNVNGLRAVMGKNFVDIFSSFDADFFCLQETKLQEGQIDLSFPSYHSYFNYAEKKGYSGTAIFTKHEPLGVRYGIGIDEHDKEGRVITLEYDDFFMVDAYIPNSQDGLKRLEYRMKWEDDFRAYLISLKEKKSVVYCGDLNVAHEEIDLKNPKTNRMNAGFTDEERDIYSWWSYRFRAREKNTGWRIDYFIVSEDIKDKVRDASIHTDVFGSDHCPVSLTLDL